MEFNGEFHDHAASNQRRSTPRIRDWVGLRADLDAVEKKKFTVGN
jgi:hypothetical protein